MANLKKKKCNYNFVTVSLAVIDMMMATMFSYLIYERSGSIVLPAILVSLTLLCILLVLSIDDE